jgi:Outer membrane lipoprotein LolB
MMLNSLAACATVAKPLSGIVPGREAETLQSTIAISVKSGERSIGGRGYLIFKQPYRFHLAVLSPFGPTLFEVFSDSERITCLIPSKQIAYSGLLSELPEQGLMKSWGMMKWVVERPPVAGSSQAALEITSSTGRRERIFFDSNGLVQRKVTEDGDEVVYNGYQNINGVPFPASIEIGTRKGDTVKIVFDEPEINQPVEEAALKPNLEGITVRPLAEFKGY